MSSNTKTGSASKIKMESFDDLFGGSSAQEIGAEQIINAPLADRRTPQEAWLRKSRKDGNADYYPQLFR